MNHHMPLLSTLWVFRFKHPKYCLALLNISLCLLGSNIDLSQAQVNSDGTLGTQVTSPDRLTFSIDGGQQSGGNLFHSFSAFSVPTNGSAIFNNGPNIVNIIGRVTGPAASNIDGLMQAQHNANLFFINPNGLFFGPNARLNIGGSFIGSTADRILFDEGAFFSATQTAPLLTVRTSPIGLGFGPVAAPIENQSRVTGELGVPAVAPAEGQRTIVGLQVKTGETLALVGGDININEGVISASSGRVELASLAPGGRVDLQAIGNQWIVEIPAGTDLGNIRLTGRRLPQRELQPSDRPFRSALVTARGQETGEVQVQSQHLTLSNSNINATLDDGGSATRGGNVSIRVPGQVVVSGFSEIAARTRSAAQAGVVSIDTSQLILRNGGRLSTSTAREGNTGNAGLVEINATELVRVSGRTPNRERFSSIFSQSPGNVSGDAGEINISTQRLIVEESGQISVGAVEVTNPDNDAPGLSIGNGGDVSINATDSILVSGVGIDESGAAQPSAIIAGAQGLGEAGNIDIKTGQLLVQDSGTVTAGSLLAESAGNLVVKANVIRLENDGQLNLTADDNGGGITLHVSELLLLRNGSSISTSGGINNAEGDGGDITIEAPLVVAVPSENSDISTDAFTGNGGEISITTDGLLGLRFRSAPTRFSDITANSEFGLDGSVEITTPEIDPSKDTATLPETVETAVVSQGCQSAGKQGNSQFTDTRRGGTPLGPQEIGSQSTWDDLRPLSTSPDRISLASSHHHLHSAQPFVEAQGWAMDSRGHLVLFAPSSSVTPVALAQAPIPCHSFSGDLEP